MNRLCLLCSSKFTKLRKAGRPKKDYVRQRKEKKFKLVVNYLLDSPSKRFDKLKEEIVKNSEGCNGRHRESFSLCSECEVLADKLLELQLELEKVQMEMINQLKIVRGVVANNREGLGLEGKDSLGNFGGSGSLEILKTFQNAVCEKGKESVPIPLVFLERFKCVQQSSIYSPIAADIIKTEPVEDDLFMSNENHPVESEDFHQFPTEDDLHEFTLPKQETEVVFDGASPPKRSRSSAVLARTRIILQNERNPTQIDKEVVAAPAPRKKSSTKAKTLKSPKKPKKEKSQLKWLDSSKIYYCDSCPFSSRRKICKFEEHLRQHETEDKPFQCELCSLKFSTKGYHDFHIDRHKGKHKLKCDICSTYFPAYDLREHMISHGDECNLLPCQLCSQYSSSLENYVEHLGDHDFKRGVPCHVCLTQLKGRRELVKHLHAVHGLLKKVPCDFEGCKMTFLFPGSLRLHRTTHTDRYECKECLRRFPASKDLKNHQLQFHSGEKRYKCDQCPARYPTYQTLQNHKIREQHGAAKHKCDVCGKEYQSYNGLQMHKVAKHDVEGHNCPICNAKFAHRSRLRCHIEARHTKEATYVCEECGKGLHSRSGYDKHKKSHGEKKFKCSYCTKAFTLKRYHEDHERTHTGERPFMCEFCGRAFIQKGVCGIHQRNCKSQRAPD